jgi:ABC-type Fe3+-siderophore transport system permease subunit
MANTSFSAVNIIAFLIALLSIYLTQKHYSQTLPVIKFFIIPIVISYLFVIIVTAIFPDFDKRSKKVRSYLQYRTLGEINAINYVQIFPPILAVLIIFIILLYNRNLN